MSVIWLDAQLSPALAPWLVSEFECPAVAVRELELHRAKDLVIFEEARKANAIVMTKDTDFADLVDRLGPPPCIIWLTCGNTSTPVLKTLLKQTLPKALALIAKGECLVEINRP